MRKILNNKYTWIAIFSLIVILAIVFLFTINWQGTIAYGFPTWLAGFVLFQLMFSAAFALFNKYFWK